MASDLTARSVGTASMHAACTRRQNPAGTCTADAYSGTEVLNPVTIRIVPGTLKYFFTSKYFIKSTRTWYFKVLQNMGYTQVKYFVQL